MQGSHTWRTAAGIIAWMLVGALALIMVESWESSWAALPVFAAVVVAWIIGERMMPAAGDDEERTS